MPVRTPLLALVVLGAACSAAPMEAAPPPVPEPVVDPPASAQPPADVAAATEAPPVDVDAGPVEVSLTIPAGAGLEIVVRSVEVGDRREVTMTSPDGVVDHHVIDGDDHWWWIPPSAREATGGVEWIHLDVAEVAEVGQLPDLVADARAPLPRPGQLQVGQEVAGREVRSIDRLGPAEEHVRLDGLAEPAVVRVRSLPAGHAIDLPERVTELRDLPEALDWAPR